jgi:hypothetical protein
VHTSKTHLEGGRERELSVADRIRGEKDEYIKRMQLLDELKWTLKYVYTEKEKSVELSELSTL